MNNQTPSVPTEEVVDMSPFKRMVMTIGTLPNAFTESLTYYEALAYFVKYLEETVIPAINQNGAATKELQDLFVELKDYVDNYFDNLDVQEEINNKLDEMAEAGTLQEIVTAYLQIRGVLAFDTLADLEDATNIIEGSICYIIGKETYNDGKGAFYKIRTITSGDVVDGDNIIALDISNTLIGEKLPNFAINQLNTQVTTINNTLNNKIATDNAIAERKETKAVKFNALDDTAANYYSERNLVSDKNSLPMVSFSNGNYPTNGMQGVAVWNKNGKIIYNNPSTIFTIDYNQTITEHTLYNGDYGHGGDACIFNDDMYISDSENNSIYKIDLNSGTKTTYTVDSDSVKNSDYNYTPVLGGICMNDSTFAYIAVCDEENLVDSTHTIRTGSTIRFYKYKFSDSSVEKLFEIPQTMVYVQGFTKDEQYFYIIGNKEFTGTTYTGNILHIIDIKTLTIYDTLSNNSNEEFEGLDYGDSRDYHGLFTFCGHGGNSAQYGVLSFGGNYSTIKVDTTDSTKKIMWTKKNGVCFVYFYVEGEFNAGTTVTISNFFKDCPKQFSTNTYVNNIPIMAVSYAGLTRNYSAHIKFNVATNALEVLTGNSSPNSTYVSGTFIYPCN